MLLAIHPLTSAPAPSTHSPTHPPLPAVAAEGLDILDFYRDPATRALYKDHMSAMVNRVNVFTGVKYRGGSGQVL